MDLCEKINSLMADGRFCEIYNEEAVVPTHCLFPSFDPISVNVRKTREGFRIHDDGRTGRFCWDYGRDKTIVANELRKASRQFHLSTDGTIIYVDVPTLDWARAAILAVANGASAASKRAVLKVSKSTEKDVKASISAILDRRKNKDYTVATEVELSGASGKDYTFDFVVSAKNRAAQMLIEVVSGHHASISHKYVAFADVINGGYSRNNNLAVFREMPRNQNLTLMSQVADIIPLESFEKSRALKALA